MIIFSSSIRLFVSGMHLKWKRESERMGEWDGHAQRREGLHMCLSRFSCTLMPSTSNLVQLTHVL